MRAALVVVVTSLIALSAASARADAPTSVRHPNLYGETGLVRATSARTGSTEVMLGAHGFGFYSPDFVVPALQDANTFLGGHTSMSLALFEIVQMSLAVHTAANLNNTAGVQASVGDLIPSLKAGYRFLPVAFAIDLRAFLPTRQREAGFAFSNSGLTARGLVTLDLKEDIDIPLRVHLNGGYTFQLGKLALGDQQEFFEQNPHFYDGPSGQLLALPAQQWFYDTADVTLAIEAPLPYVTPFVEATYITALAVPAERGVNGASYNALSDAHIIITPGVRITPANGFAIDVGADIGLTGNGGGVTVDAAQLVNGQPLNPLWLARVGVSHAFDPFAAPGASAVGRGGGAFGQLTGCVTDEGGTPVTTAVLEGPSLHGARIAADAKGCFTTPPLVAGKAELTVTAPGLEPQSVVTSINEGAVSEVNVKLVGRATSAPVAANGTVKIAGYVTNREDEVIDADIEITDARGSRSVGKASAGAFTADAAAGRVWIAAKSDKHLANGVELVADGAAGTRTTIVLRDVPKKRVATLEKDKIALSVRVPFDYKTPRLQSAAEFALDEVVDLLLRNPNVRVRIEVYAEGLDTPAAGQQLADDRTRAIIEHLAQRGVARTRLEGKGTAGVDEKSRRVEIVVLP